MHYVDSWDKDIKNDTAAKIDNLIDRIVGNKTGHVKLELKLNDSDHRHDIFKNKLKKVRKKIHFNDLTATPSAYLHLSEWRLDWKSELNSRIEVTF